MDHRSVGTLGGADCKRSPEGLDSRERARQHMEEHGGGKNEIRSEDLEAGNE